MYITEMFQSVCWTLVHSLWQGLFLALLAGLVVMLTKKTSSVMRYNLLGLLGLVFIVGVGITLYTQIHNHKPTTYQTTEPVTSIKDLSSPVSVPFNPSTTAQPYTVIHEVTGFLNHNAFYIVALWFVIFVFKIYRLLRGLQQVHYLRHYGLFEVPAEWNNRLEELKQILQMSGRVRLVESALVKVPSVMGFFKPVILLPVGLLTQMPAAEAEAILLHELAHIRRKDYLANLIQGFGEVVFFFNPGFLWVSSLIKTERENCCDDLAVSATQCKIGLVKALVYTQQYSGDQNQLVLGFGKKKTPLLDRAKRILYNNNQTLSNMEKTLLSIGIVLGLCVAFAFTGNGHTYNKFAPAPTHTDTLTSDSLERAHRRVELEKQRAEAEKALADYEHKMEPVNNKEQRDEMEMGRIDLEMKIAEIEMALANIDLEEAEIEMAKAEIEMTKAEEERIQAEKEAETAMTQQALLMQELHEALGTHINSYGLTHDKLIVNGKEQSTTLHQQVIQYLGDNISATYRYDLKTGHIYTPEELYQMRNQSENDK